MSACRDTQLLTMVLRSDMPQLLPDTQITWIVVVQTRPALKLALHGTQSLSPP